MINPKPGSRVCLMGLFSLAALLPACPTFPSTTQNSSESEDAPVEARGVAGSGALDEEIALGEAAAFEPPPSEATLCKLRWRVDTIEEVVDLLGKANSQQMNASEAALSYRFQQDLTMHLTFRYSDGSVDPEEASKLGRGWLRKGYILVEGTLMGRDYPTCWPHKDFGVNG